MGRPRPKYKNAWAINDLMGQAEEETKKRRAFDQMIAERQIAETEANGRADRSKANEDRWRAAENDYLGATQALGKDNDAFEVSAGRMDPMEYSLKYGGGVSSGNGRSLKGVSTKSSGGNTKQPDYATMLIDAYKAAGKDLGEKEDFLLENKVYFKTSKINRNYSLYPGIIFWCFD